MFFSWFNLIPDNRKVCLMLKMPSFTYNSFRSKNWLQLYIIEKLFIFKLEIKKKFCLQ